MRTQTPIPAHTTITTVVHPLFMIGRGCLLFLVLLLAGADAETDAHFAVVSCAVLQQNALAGGRDGMQQPSYYHEIPGTDTCVAVWHGLDTPAETAAHFNLAPQALERDPEVHALLHVPPDHDTRVLWGSACRSNAGGVLGLERGYAGGAFSWGVDRVDDGGLDGAFCVPYDGQSVDLYVADTGVDPHDTFALPVRQGFSTYGSGGVPNAADPDPNGHGTHVAGLAASQVYGVAPGAAVTAVQVLGPSGSGATSGVLAGMLWVLEDRRRTGRRPGCVVNLSLGGGGPPTETGRQIYARLRDEGQCVVVAAAGNSGRDACNFWPAGYASTVTVAATDPQDRLVRTSRWASNHGPCVTLSAPGLGIVSAQGADQGWAIFSGTSMASPIAAGAAAVLYDEYVRADAQPPSAAAVEDRLLARSGPYVRDTADTGTAKALVQLGPTSAPPVPIQASEASPDLEVLFMGLLVLVISLCLFW